MAVRDAPGSHTEGESGGAATIRLTLLGGFRAEHRVVVPESAWQQRRSAKALVKLMACHPAHSLHREQILDLLWPDMDFTSALNSFGKALHVARRALEPGMPSRGTSSYLRLADEVLTLLTDSIWIDADDFQLRADEALRRGDVSSLDAATRLYSGDLLPEDTYETWTVARRTGLAELYTRLLVSLADALETRGQVDDAIEQLARVIQRDPAREDVHRRLMGLHAANGRRLLAIRQYQLCCEALRQEVDAEPEGSTVALYEDIRANRIGDVRPPPTQSLITVSIPKPLPATEHVSSVPFIGRESALSRLISDLQYASDAMGTAAFVSGPLGVGKSRLVDEVAQAAVRGGALVLSGASLDAEDEIPFAPFAQALEVYMGTLDITERHALADRYPALVDVLPSLSVGRDTPTTGPAEGGQNQLFSTIARVLTDLSTGRTLLLVLEDLHAASDESLRLLHYLTRLAHQRQLLIVGTFREEELAPDSKLRDIVATGMRDRSCHHIYLSMLSRADCDSLVEALVVDGVPSTPLLDQIWAASSGNPFLVTETVRAMQERDEITLSHGQWRAIDRKGPQIPQQVRKLVDTYLGHIDECGGRVLGLIAVAGPDVSFKELHWAAKEAIDPEITELMLLDIIDTAIAKTLIVERGAGYAFTYPLFAAALRHGLSRQRGAQFHAAVAHAVEQCRPGAVELLAFHYARNQDRERGAVYLQRAAERARSGGLPEVEEGHLWQLLERLHILGRTEDAEQIRSALRSLIQNVGHVPLATVHGLQRGAG